MTEDEDEMVRWHHQLNGRECEQTPGDSDGQGSLACCGPWSHRDLDTTERVNKNNTLISQSLEIQPSSSSTAPIPIPFTPD